MRRLFALFLLCAAPVPAHRLDEYLQGTLLSIGRDQVRAEITLSPGVAIFPVFLAAVDTNADGSVTEAEQRAYGERVLRDISLRLDGERLRPRLLTVKFAGAGEMKEGLGGVRIEFAADLPPGGGTRKLIFENHHQSQIAAYQVNCLVPTDPKIRIVWQQRDYAQSFYQLEYEQEGARSTGRWQWGWLAIVGIALLGRLLWVWRAAHRPASAVDAGWKPVPDTMVEQPSK